MCQYALHLDQESPYSLTQTRRSGNWPRKGDMEFRESLKYRAGLHMVLKNLSFKVDSHEKIGICGRTGTGKSSIKITLFQSVEKESGGIIIDGVDISKIGLI